jgi:fatty acid desaturase
MGALGHDSGHFAASHRYPIINEWGVWAMSLICNPIMWQHQHTYGHHSFTNEFSHDPDLHHLDRFLRVHRLMEHSSIYEKQRQLWYVVVCYLLVVFGTCLKIPVDMMIEGHLNGVVEWQDRDRWSKQLGMRLHLALYVAIIVVAPFFAHSSSSRAAIAVALHIATLGSIFGYFSQVNHINEASLEADIETKSNQEQSAQRDPRLANSWAVAQVETSNNFAPSSLMWHFLSNGLNLQIEHHLFPGLNHGHLHLIAPVVRKTCEEYGVQYKCYDSWIDVMKIHLAWYKKMSYVPTAASNE